jgi:hypothetical protein
VGGETSFLVNDLVGRETIIAARGGLTKKIVKTTTSDTQEIQILGGNIYLPTGDVAMAGELFTFLYK